MMFFCVSKILMPAVSWDHKLKINSDKTQITEIVTVVIVTVVTEALVTVVIVTYFSKNNLTPQQLMRCSRAAFRDSCDVFNFPASCLFLSVLVLMLLSAHVKRFSANRMRDLKQKISYFLHRCGRTIEDQMRKHISLYPNKSRCVWDFYPQVNPSVCEVMSQGMLFS